MTQPRFAVARDDRRECALYRIYVLDPRTNYTTVTLGYIGETGRMPFTRFIEHLYDQPWGDTIVGHPQVDSRVFASKAEVLAAEKVAVLAEKPLYNIEYQVGAEHQIPQWVARQQRAERDAQRGVVSPDWASKGSGQPARPLRPQQPARAASRLPVVWRHRRNWALGWLAATAALWLVGALFAAPEVPAVSGWWWLILAAAVSSTPLVLHLRRKRRRPAWLALAVAVAVLLALTGV